MFKPKYTITPEINSRIAEIERLRTVVNQAKILPELEVNLRFRATVEAVHSSTSIEGNPLNEQQVKKVLKGEVVRAPDYAITEVLNYKKALDKISQLISGGELVNAKTVLNLHGIVMERLLPTEKVGYWRPGPVYIVDEIDGNEIVRYTSPDARDVPQLVNSFLKWIPLQIDAKVHPVLLAGLVHYLFVSIHPFSDGNGRTTRLLVHYYLKKWQYDFRDTISLDAYYLQHQSEYYQALSLGDTFDERMAADITPFLDFFTKGFLESARSLSQYIITGKIPNGGEKPLRLSYEELTLLDFVHQFGSISIKEAVEILQISKRSIQRRLIGLVDKNILKIEGEGPATRYTMRMSSE